MMNNFIRNPVLRTSHTIREPGYYINTIKIEHLSLVCTLANTSPCPLFYAFYHLLYLRRGSNSRSSDSYSEAFPLSYEGMLGVRWVSIPLPLESQSSTLPIELQTPYKSRIVVSNHSKVGYEPTLFPEHTGCCGKHWNRTKYPKVHLA